MIRVLGLVVVVISACRAPPKAGSSCAETELPLCADTQTALVCDNHFWAAKNCGAACTEAGGRITCSGEGDVCSSGTVCSSPNKGLDCFSGRYAAVDCNGPAGCSGTACDQSTAAESSRCLTANEGSGACNLNHDAVLSCTHGFWVKSQQCRACAVSSGEVVCTK